MNSLKWEDCDWDAETYREFLDKFYNFQLNPTNFQKRQSAFAIAEKGYTKASSIVEDSSTFKNLNLFCGDRPNDIYVAQALNRTETEIGKVQFYLMLSDIIDNTEILIYRQNIIKNLLSNPRLMNDLQAQLQKIGVTENILLSIYRQDTFLQQLKTRNLFTSPFFAKLNNNANALEFLSISENSKRFYYLFSEVFAGSILSIYAGTIFAQQIAKLCNVNLNWSEHLESHATKNVWGGMLAHWLWEKDHALLKGVIAAIGATYIISSLKESYDWALDCLHLEKILHTKVNCFSQTINTLKKMALIISNHSSKLKELDELRPLFEIVEPSRTFHKNYAALLKLLANKTTAASPSLFSHKGRIIYAYKLMHECKEEIAKLLQAAGFLDAYLGIARLVQEQANKKNVFSFPTFLEKNKPFIKIDHFWQPTIAVEKAVSNSIEIGGDTMPNNAVITGPNAGGKSTLIKAIAINLILAQSIGIVAAKNCVITPLRYISTYMNITDDLANGKSLFKAEVLQAQKIVTRVRSLKDNEFSFTIFDELFNGTTPLEGTQAAWTIATCLGSQKNNISLFATHFEKLTELNKQNFTNYKVSVSIGSNGTISYPFILEPGISHQHIALIILNQEGIDTSIFNETK